MISIAPSRAAVLASWCLAACSSSAPSPEGLRVVVAPLNLPGIGVACYDLAVTSATDTVWTKGDPDLTRLGADQSEPADATWSPSTPADDDTVCSDDYGNDDGGDIVYIGACDASPDADVDGDSDNGVQNTVTLWVDGLYNATGTADLGAWQDPCPGGCSLRVDCDENADTLVRFDLTILREANQGFFDVAVDFGDIFCSAKFDTCYPNATATVTDDERITLLFGGDAVRDWTGVFGFACSAGAGADTVLAYGEVAVACTDARFVLDPTLPEGSNHVATSGTRVLHYGIYRGDEQLDCDPSAAVESCAKRYWNLSIDLADLAGLDGCTFTATATATDDNDGFAGGLPTGVGVSYPYIEVAAALGSACQHNGLGDGGAVATVYRGNLDGLPAPEPVCAQFDGTTVGDVCAAPSCDEGEVLAIDGVTCLPPLPAPVLRSFSIRTRGSDPDELTVAGGLAFFTANDGEAPGNHGEELWASDGTAAGTRLVVDLNPGDGGSSWPEELTAVGDVLYFSASNSDHPYALWRTDGTTTTLVSDIVPGGAQITEATAVGTTLFFTADDGVHGSELWSSDGTEAGTRLVVDLEPGTDDAFPEELVAGNGVVFFKHGERGTLFVSDGTEAGTHELAPGGEPVQVGARGAAFIGGFLYFQGNQMNQTSPTGMELWRSDGTDAGTTLVADIDPGSGSSSPVEMFGFGGDVYFAARDDEHGLELWKSDGTAAGTSVVDINPGSAESGPYAFAACGARLCFIADDGTHDWELWATDGTSTTLVRDIFDGPMSSNPWQLVTVGDVAYFQADDGVNGEELWKTDGTFAGTVMVADVNTLAARGSNPDGIVALGAKVLFFGNDDTHQEEVWVSDGTAAGTFLSKDINPDPIGAEPKALTALGGVIYFSADDGIAGRELWKDDGSGPVLVADVFPGRTGSEPEALTAVGTTLFFTADDGTTGRELWKTDGTVTTRVADLGPGDSQLRELTAAGGLLYFVAGDGNELWQSDGTTNGTGVVPGGARDVWGLVAAGASLFFDAQTADPPTGYELWTATGGAAAMLADLVPGATGSEPDGAFAVGDVVYFTAWDPNFDFELWRSDGTAGGTFMIADINPNGDSYPYGFGALGAAVFFAAYDDDHGDELWKTDGTAAGTVLVKDIVPGSTDSNPYDLTAVGGVLYFGGTDSNGHEVLWKSDGTAAGTVHIADGVGRLWDVDELTAAGGLVWFRANDGLYGQEVWRSDGTTPGTRIVIDLAPNGGSNPQDLVVVGDRLYFAADDGTHGRQLWSVATSP